MYRINKMNFRLQIMAVFFVSMFFANSDISAQSNLLNKYGLLVIKDIAILQEEIALDSNKQMVDLQKAVPHIILDLKYGTTDNFMHQQLYQDISVTYLRKPAANALKEIVEDLQKLHLTLKIFDAYRPYYITQKMWEMIKDDRYAADPSKGSGHNRGIAVDLTLIDLHSKKELPMGTGFDNFSDTAHQDFTDLPGQILKNRNILKNIMEKYGFIGLETEWWHFYLPNSSSYELLDLSFAQLKTLSSHEK